LERGVEHSFLLAPQASRIPLAAMAPV